MTRLTVSHPVHLRKGSMRWRISFITQHPVCFTVLKSSGANVITSAMVSVQMTHVFRFPRSTISVNLLELISMINFSKINCRFLLSAFLLSLGLLANLAQAQTPTEIQAALDTAHAKYLDLQEGANADYIPALAAVDPNIYGIVLVTTDGKIYTAGDIKSEVSIQSISKV